MAATAISLDKITSATARAMVAAAETEADRLGAAVAIAIADQDGTLKAFARMDGAPARNVDVAQHKAYTAALFQFSTHELADDLSENIGQFSRLPHAPRLSFIAGGYPVYDGGAGGSVIGAVGVSGGHFSDEMTIAKAAIAAVAQPSF